MNIINGCVCVLVTDADIRQSSETRRYEIICFVLYPQLDR